jgi:carboxypeptidase PM20D1
MISSKLKKRAEENLSLMIQCKTVSNRDYDKEDSAEFKKFHNLLIKRFPLLYRKFKPITIGRNALVFYIHGTSNPNADPKGKEASVLMAHYDVVPAEGEKWDKEPFSGDIDEEFIWGRGAIDTKGTLCAVLSAVEEQLSTDWKPEHDLYLAFSGEEEIDGESCPSVVQWLKEREVKVSFVLDEGGAIVDKVLPGQRKSCAMIGIAEKGSISVSCSISLAGGHASAPPEHTTAGLISQAVCSIEKGRFKAQFTEPVRKMFTLSAPHCAQPYKFIFSHSRFFSPLLKTLSPLMGSEFNALMHTTCAVTKLEASQAFNVIPPVSAFGLNIRLLGKDTIEGAIKHIEKRCRKVEKYLQKKTKQNVKQIQISVLTGDNPSRISDTNCPQWNMLNDVITSQWPQVFVSPYLMMACTDSRHYGTISDKVYRFSPMPMTKEDRAMIHGKNERIKKENLHNAVEFYIQLMNKL